MWTSATLVTACGRPRPTQLPSSGPEVARALTRRGAANLAALTRLSAALRLAHPSDQAASADWEQLILAGIRGLEAAQTRVELVEGLRGLFADVAPTVRIWRAEPEPDADADADPEALACPEPESADEDQDADEAGAAAESKQADSGDEGEGDSPDAGEGEDRARELDPGGKSRGPLSKERSGPPMRTKRGAPSKQRGDEDAEGEEDEAVEGSEGANEGADEPDSPDASMKADAASEDAPESEADAASKDEPEAPAPKASEDEKTPAQDGGDEKGEEDSEDERPAPHEALVLDEEGLELTQWVRRGHQRCARRIRFDPRQGPLCKPTSRRAQQSCAVCELDKEITVHNPATAAALDLGLGIEALVPTALWTREGKTLPSEPSVASTEPIEFDARRSWDYSLDDRATRLLAVIRAWTLLDAHFAHVTRVPEPTRAQLLTTALCGAAEAEAVTEFAAVLDELLVGFGDGQGALIVDGDRKRYTVGLTLGWVEERVVVLASTTELIEPGDVVAKVDGVGVDVLVAEALRETPAAHASAAIERAVGRLLERRERGASVQLRLLRDRDGAEEALAIEARANLRAGGRSVAAKPSQRPFVRLDEGHVYVDATRIGSLSGAARKLGRASGLILDLRGELADRKGSLLAHFLTEAQVLVAERVPAGPNADARLELDEGRELPLEPQRPTLTCPVVVLADARTRGRAELELAGFEDLGATIVGSASAGDSGEASSAWLPGGWQVHFTSVALHRRDGSRLWGRGVRPSVHVEPTRASLREGSDPLLLAAEAVLQGN